MRFWLERDPQAARRSRPFRARHRRIEVNPSGCLYPHDREASTVRSRITGNE
jgi:hypothetical protein